MIESKSILCEACRALYYEQIEELEAQLEQAREPALRIKQWCNAYPLDIFPEPDFKLARIGLKSVGITIDQVSASNMRHVLNGITKYANELNKALEDKGDTHPTTR